MITGYVMCWWQRDEFAEQREDFQADSSFDFGGDDLLAVDHAVEQMQKAPLTTPLADYDVRCTFDSRIINGYDFNFSKVANGDNSASSHGWQATFNVPVGYRAIPRKWQVQFDAFPTGTAGGSTCQIEQGGAALANNQNIIIGMGTDNPIETFFICEEETTFGISGTNLNFALLAYTVNINVYGNLIPVSEVALPLTASNPRLGSIT